MTGFLTIAAKNYLPYARVLMDSVARFHPDALRIVVLTDEPDNFFDPATEPFHVFHAKAAQLPGGSWFFFKYSVLELNTAVKPYVLALAFQRFQVDNLIYLDPDISLFSALDELLHLLDSADIVLTPHLTAPLPADERQPSELDILRSGTYNLGFIGLRSGAEVSRFLDWWQDKLADQCRLDFARGLFVDQRWVDLVPGLFSAVAILRHSGYNVAYWNLPHRPVRAVAGGYQVNGEALRFFHFSGLNPDRPEDFSHYQNRLQLQHLGDAIPLVRQYIAALRGAGFDQTRFWPYTHNFFCDGTPLPDLARDVLSVPLHSASCLPDPFSSAGAEAVIASWTQPVLDTAGRPTKIPWLCERLYRLRPDVQKLFPDALGRDQEAVLNWYYHSGKDEHTIPEAFFAPTRTQFEYVPPPTASTGKPPSRLSPSLPPIAHALYEHRKDLRARFPRPEDLDREPFFLWLLTSGRDEYGFTPEELAGMNDAYRLTKPHFASRWKLAVRSMAGTLRHRLADVRNPLGSSHAAAIRRTELLSPSLPEPLLLPATGSDSPLLSAYRQAILDGQRDPGRGGVQPFTLSLVNPAADLQPASPARRGEPYHIGFCPWPTQRAPQSIGRALAAYHEIWTPSRFSQAALGVHTDRSVVRLPCPVHAPQVPKATGFAENAFVVVAVGQEDDPQSMAETVQAFSIAFHQILDCHLAIYPAPPGALPPRVRIMGSGQIASWLNRADCFLSLHRFNSFSLPLAQAMALGRPIVCTAYGGTLDITPAGKAFLVNYQLRQSDSADPGVLEAKPFLDHGVALLRVVYQDKKLRDRIARSGQEYAVDHYHPAVAQSAIRARLVHVATTLQNPGQAEPDANTVPTPASRYR